MIKAGDQSRQLVENAEMQTGLIAATGQLDIYLREQLGVEQGAVLHA